MNKIHFFTSTLSNRKEPGFLEKKLSEDLIRKLCDYLSFEDLGQWIVTIKNPDLRTKLVNRGYFIQRCALLEERFGDNEWIQANIHPIPREMQEILDGPDGHFYTAIFKTHYLLTKDHKIVSVWPERIKKLISEKGLDCPGMSDLLNIVRDCETVFEKENMHWMLVTKTVVEKSRNQMWTKQNEAFSDWTKAKKERQGFEIIEATTLVYALLWHYQAFHHERIYSDQPLTFGRCQIEYELVDIGGFSTSGFRVCQSFFADNVTGVGGERKFFKAILPWKLESGSSDGLATASIEAGST